MKEVKAQEAATQVVTNDIDHGLDHLESGHAENGHEPEEVVVSEGVTDVHDEVHDHVDEVPAVEDVVETVVEVSPDPQVTHAVDAMVVVDVHQVVEPEVQAEALVEEPLADGNVDPNGSVEFQEIAPAKEETVHNAVSELPTVGDDIEDMVVMLESVSLSKHRPQSIASIPDEHGEIPDEDQS